MAAKGLWTCLLTVALGAAAHAEAPAPLSAIGWLSNSVADEQVEPGVANPVPAASTPGAIRVLPLDAPVQDTAGLLDAEALGVPKDLWGRSSAGDLEEALQRLSPGSDAPPVISRFLSQLLQARLDPPIDAVATDRFFFARIDRLLGKGHVVAAAGLMETAGVEDARSFRRQFDIALLTETETEACREIEGNPDLSPTYPARIFCLARLGQFDVAALTLGNAETLGILSEEEDALLLHFLDPELFEGEPIPRAPSLPTPLQFRLYEAVGERISTEGLPIPFAFADMSDTVGWKARLSAAERLAAARAIPFERLLEAYRERGASASGGVWERVRAFQALADAVDRGDEKAIGTSLPRAWEAAGQAGYASAFAEWILPRIEALTDAAAVSRIAFEIALLAEDPEAAARFARSSREDRFLVSLANGQIGTEPAGDALGRAVLRGLSMVNAGPAYEALIADDRRGEALFRALQQLADGATGNPDVTAQSLAALRRIGLEALARQIAVELVLREGAA
ncbi:MAG: hypothetical protein AAGA06_04055 [Pseudomonadota bacterium]